MSFLLRLSLEGSHDCSMLCMPLQGFCDEQEFDLLWGNERGSTSCPVVGRYQMGLVQKSPLWLQTS